MCRYTELRGCAVQDLKNVREIAVLLRSDEIDKFDSKRSNNMTLYYNAK